MQERFCGNIGGSYGDSGVALMSKVLREFPKPIFAWSTPLQRSTEEQGGAIASPPDLDEGEERGEPRFATRLRIHLRHTTTANSSWLSQFLKNKTRGQHTRPGRLFGGFVTRTSAAHAAP